jgi:predicted ATPase/DNA-binding SARP family transcriptional activator
VDDGLEVRVFGAVEVWRDGERRPVGGPKPRQLLALLLAHRGQVLSADRLCEELWGDEQPASPRAVLQSHVSRLRRILEPEARIVGRPPGYSLEIADELVDAGRFERLLGTATDVAHPPAAVAGLEAALVLCRGPAFAEFAEDDWARGEAVRLEELRLRAEEELIEAMLASGDAAGAVSRAESLVVGYPLRERFWMQLMLGLYRSGRAADALRRADAMRNQLRDEAGLEPTAALRDLERRMLDDDPTLLLDGASAPVERRVARPAPSETTRLVGREEALDAIVGLVRRERLVTLTGPGGVGKTRLALRVARELWQDVPDGVFVAELAPVRDLGATSTAIAAVLDVHPRQHLSLDETLAEYLRDRRTLLVLDNCEHVASAVVPLVDRLLSWCPELSVLATSRAPLGLAGEHVWTVAPLAVAPEGADASSAAEAAAVELFVERATAARPGFVLDADNVDAIGEIVRRLDGIPLAIELAAARVRAMSPTALAQRLDQRFELLTAANSSTQPSHRALRDLVSWSHDLLTVDERSLFRRLSVFAGGFDLDAAEYVGALDDLPADRISALLADLVDKSMVQLVDPDAPRYRLLETLRDFGLDQLSDDELETLRSRHRDWYLGVAERSAVGFSGPDEATVAAALSRDFDNLRAAYATSQQRADLDAMLRFVASLREFGFRNLRSEITTWAEELIEMRGASSHPLFPMACSVAAYGGFVRGDLERAIDLGERAAQAAQELGVDTSGLAERALANTWFYRGEPEIAQMWGQKMLESARRGSPARLAHAFYMKSVAYTSVGDTVRAANFAGEARAAAEASGSPTAIAQVEYALGLALESTDPDEAAQHLRLAADLAASAGNRWVEAFALTEVLWLQARQGDPAGALAGYADVVELWYRGGDWANQWLSVRHIFGILFQLHAYESAAIVHGALVAAGAAYALPFEPTDAERLAELVDDLRHELGAARYATAVRRGAAMRDAEIVHFVRTEIDRLTRDAGQSRTVRQQ